MRKEITYIEAKALVHSVFGTELRNHLEALYLYDSVLIPGSTDGLDSIKILVIMNSNDPHILVSLKKGHENLTRKTKNRCQVAYQIFDLESLRESLDVFPIEFLELSLHRDLVLGTDVLGDIAIDRSNLRQECEFYLRTHLLKLKEGFIRSSMPNSELIRASFPFILSVFKYLLTLVNSDSAKIDSEPVAPLAEKLNFRASVFQDILRDLQSPECGVHLFDYISELEAITAQVDRLND